MRRAYYRKTIDTDGDKALYCDLFGIMLNGRTTAPCIPVEGQTETGADDGGIDMPVIETVLQRLTGRDADIIRYRYVEHLSLRDIGSRMDLSAERVRQLLDLILCRLRRDKALISMLTAGASDGTELGKDDSGGDGSRGTASWANSEGKPGQEDFAAMEKEIAAIWHSPVPVISTTSLGLSTHAENRLLSNGIFSTWDLAAAWRDLDGRFSQLPGVGSRASEEIVDCIRSLVEMYSGVSADKLLFPHLQTAVRKSGRPKKEKSGSRDAAGRMHIVDAPASEEGSRFEPALLRQEGSDGQLLLPSQECSGCTASGRCISCERLQQALRRLRMYDSIAAWGSETLPKSGRITTAVAGTTCA